MHWRRKWQPTPVFLPGEPQDGGAWWAAVHGVAQGRTRLKRLSSSSSAVYSLVIMIINLNAVISYQQLIFKCLPSVLPTAMKQNCFYFPTVYLESLHKPGIVKRVGITYYMG